MSDEGVTREEANADAKAAKARARAMRVDVAPGAPIFNGRTGDDVEAAESRQCANDEL